MSASLCSNLTKDQLLDLKNRLSTWAAVRRHLGLSRDRMVTLRKRLGCYPQLDTATKTVSCLDAYHDQLVECAAQGMTCPEMVKALNLPVQAEAVRRWLHRNNIPLLAKRGAQPGEKHRDWKGGRTLDKYGYVLLHMPNHPDARKNGRILEHRWVMEQHLGRQLDPMEVVHHINGDKQDNRVENLEVFDSNGQHLGVTLKGQVPKWSEGGQQRVYEGLERGRQKLAERALA